ncbi:nucleotide pyrophosphohydrolase [Candidatus Parcubacteria bacterium]|nr:MAG: nucleotide pyrophosphohydrolase [Candidatus Parcubacteria bacterium]
MKELIEKIRQFRDARDWKQFHNPKDMALSLTLEAAEVLEHFQWKSKEEIEEYVRTNKEDIGEELADVLFWVLIMSHDLEIDIKDAFEKKMKKNEMNYPVEKAKGRHAKYTELQRES